MTFVEESIISGFIGEVISRCVDFSWTKIKEAVKNRKNKYQNIESQIYNVVVNVLNQITYYKFESDQDKIYQAAEKLLVGYKEDRCDSIEVVRLGLQVIGISVNNDKYIEFKTLLYQELCEKDYEELYRQIRLLQQDKESSKTSRIEQKIDRVQQSADETNRRLDAFRENNKEKDNIQNKEPLKSRTQEYADKWKDNMFLNNSHKRDKNAGVNVKLREVYLEEHLPHYIWGDDEEPSMDLKKLLSEYIHEKKKCNMLLILGQPGIGKSTLITWITIHFKSRKDDIFVYQFATDLKDIDWENVSHEYNIADRLLKELNLSYDILSGKVLIIDGFDEISIGGNRVDTLNQLYWQLIKNSMLHNFLLIITCRENYILKPYNFFCDYITLYPWDEYQIRSFCNVYSEKTGYRITTKTKANILKNQEILGVPLILYMVLALNISIEREGSIVDIYDRIFALDGGIYDRCIGYERPHRIKKIKIQIHEVSKRIAMWMFENKPNEAKIPQVKFLEICRDVMQEYKLESMNTIQDFFIGNYFKLVKYCEGIETEELYFVHRSIYEYFVAEYMFSSIEESLKGSKKTLASAFARLLHRNRLSVKILDFLKFKVRNSKVNGLFDVINETFQSMLQYGMTYYTEESYEKIIDAEMMIFVNMLEIIHFWTECCVKFDDSIYNYLKYNRDINLNLRGVIINTKKKETLNLTKRLYLKKADLLGANLSMEELIEANLEEANLIGANLRGANLSGANLRKSCLIRTDLREADLSRADLYRTDLTRICLQNANLEASIWYEADIRKILSELRIANFTYLIVREDKGVKIVQRSELFPEKSNL